jgi:hypothetical protein
MSSPYKSACWTSPKSFIGYARHFCGSLLAPYLGSTASMLSPLRSIISWNDAGMLCSGESCHLLASCLRKCTFLCPRENPCSISHASFWLPLTVVALKVVGTLRQRYVECRAASKVFSRPHPNMALYGYSMSRGVDCYETFVESSNFFLVSRKRGQSLV